MRENDIVGVDRTCYQLVKENLPWVSYFLFL